MEHLLEAVVGSDQLLLRLQIKLIKREVSRAAAITPFAVEQRGDLGGLRVRLAVHLAQPVGVLLADAAHARTGRHGRAPSDDVQRVRSGCGSGRRGWPWSVWDAAVSGEEADDDVLGGKQLLVVHVLVVRLVFQRAPVALVSDEQEERVRVGRDAAFEGFEAFEQLLALRLGVAHDALLRVGVAVEAANTPLLHSLERLVGHAEHVGREDDEVDLGELFRAVVLPGLELVDVANTLGHLESNEPLRRVDLGAVREKRLVAPGGRRLNVVRRRHPLRVLWDGRLYSVKSCVEVDRHHVRALAHPWLQLGSMQQS
eukprot:316533-Pleurochrysis_carterae.AAC.2